jgi:hypothetical protein
VLSTKILAGSLKVACGFTLLQPLFAAAQRAAPVAMRIASDVQVVQEDPGWPPAMLAALLAFFVIAGVFAVAIASMTIRRDRVLEEKVKNLASDVEKLRNQSK